MQRKHLVKSAAYWYNTAKDYDAVSIGEKRLTDNDRLMAMEQAYNHAENAVAWLLEKATPEVKAQFEKLTK